MPMKNAIFLSPKNEYFPKGLTHPLGQKIQNFFLISFSVKQAKKKNKTLIQREIKPFRTVKMLIM